MALHTFSMSLMTFPAVGFFHIIPDATLESNWHYRGARQDYLDLHVVGDRNVVIVCGNRFSSWYCSDKPNLIHQRKAGFILSLGVQDDDRFPALPQIGDDPLEQMRLALAGVSQDQDVGVGLVIGAAVKVRQDVAAEFVPA